jgi:hypothetical protein
MNPYAIAAAAVLGLHLVWIAWVIFGWLPSRRRAVLRWLHLGSLIWGIIIEIAPWDCPLTVLEQWLESKAGMTPYGEPFLVHYLELLVYPNVPLVVLVPAAVAVCGFNLFLHARKLLRSAKPRGSQAQPG